jgi:hypothetical protein
MRNSIVITLCLLLAVSAVVRAEYIEGPIKWSQLPDMDTGTDQYSVHVGDAVASNDYRCVDPDPVVAVRWWGSYLQNVGVPDDGVVNHPTFELAFHYDNPANVQDIETGETLPYSHPTLPPLYHTWVRAQEVYVGSTPAGERVYRYDAWLPEAFDQEYWKNLRDLDPLWGNPHGSDIFWIDIGRVHLDANGDPVDPPTIQWGWHESETDKLDLAISNPNWHFGPWANITVLDRDLAFEVITIPEPATMLLLGFGALALLKKK